MNISPSSVITTSSNFSFSSDSSAEQPVCQLGTQTYVGYACGAAGTIMSQAAAIVGCYAKTYEATHPRKALCCRVAQVTCFMTSGACNLVGGLCLATDSNLDLPHRLGGIGGGVLASLLNFSLGGRVLYRLLCRRAVTEYPIEIVSVTQL